MSVDSMALDARVLFVKIKIVFGYWLPWRNKHRKKKTRLKYFNTERETMKRNKKRKTKTRLKDFNRERNKDKKQKEKEKDTT